MQAQPQATIAAEVRRHREGDRVATEAIARRATRLALRTAASIMRSREEASDVAQDVAVDVLDHPECHGDRVMWLRCSAT